GEISGINVSNFPGWYDTFYRPGKEIAAIEDWDERVNKIAEEAPDWNIGAIAGIPSWVLLMLQRVVEKNGVKNIHEVWPNFSVYSSGGVAFETYRTDFEAISGREITVMDTYLASEGFVAYTARPGTMAMQLALEHGYFYEFIPFDARGVDEMGNLLEDPESHQLNDVTTGQEYVLVLSTCAGAWRYQIGDVIKFTSLKPYEIVITGRTKFFLNVVGSQLSEEKMDNAILETSKALNVSVNEYSVAAIKNENGDYIHQWIVVSNNEIDATKFKKLLDNSLMESNKNYKVARQKALKDIRVHVIDKAQYKGYLAADKKVGGQVKTPKVMSAEKMEKFLEFLSS
ncbi:MAG: GH3 auxin-responsive promoter family protein, partial [Flavobacteriales bacterium]|nr:GH3 auxin-responsive promoter family protein [Flavobacteriales bacterium]